MKKLLVLTIILIQSLTNFSQSIETKPELNTDDIFLGLTFLEESPNFYNEKVGYDYAYRFLIATEEIYDHIFIEKVVYGEEGGSKKIQWRKKLDMDMFYELGVKGEIFNVKFKNWKEEDSFIMFFRKFDMKCPI